MQGIAVSGTREEYGYRPWLVRMSVEGNSNIKDRIHYGTSSGVMPTRTDYKNCTSEGCPKVEGFWAPSNTKCRIQAECLENDKACFRQISPRAKLPKESYVDRVKSSLAFDASPPSVVRSALNEGPAKKAWARYSRRANHISGGRSNARKQWHALKRLHSGAFAIGPGRTCQGPNHECKHCLTRLVGSAS